MTPQAEEILRQTSLMRFIPEEHVERVRDLFDEVRIDFGEYLLRQGEDADALYVLVSGRARVLKDVAGGGETVLNRLMPGAEFGEGALLEGGVRNASVRASTALGVLRLGRLDFLDLVDEFPCVRESLELLERWRTLHAFLHESSNFGRLPSPALNALISALQPVRFEKGSVIVREADPAGAMYVVRSGRVRVFTGPEGSAVHRAFYREGDFFRGTIDPDPFSAGGDGGGGGGLRIAGVGTRGVGAVAAATSGV
jgi:CRP-like cAMP-binding protein